MNEALFWDSRSLSARVVVWVCGLRLRGLGFIEIVKVWVRARLGLGWAGAGLGLGPVASFHFSGAERLKPASLGVEGDS